MMVSIVCLTYNIEAFIREAIDSFLMQQVAFRYEIIVHDDASIDGTPDIIKGFQDRHPDIIKPIFQTENQYALTGKFPYANAYAQARGKYIALCDGDDYWTDPLKLQKQVDFMEEHPDYALCYHDYYRLQDGELSVNSTKKPKDYSGDELVAFQVGGTGITSSTMLFRNFYTPETKQDFEDFWGHYSLIVLLGTFGKCKFIEGVEPSMYRVHGKNFWTGQPDMEAKTKEKYKRLYELFVERKNTHCANLRKGFLNVQRA